LSHIFSKRAPIISVLGNILPQLCFNTCNAIWTIHILKPCEYAMPPDTRKLRPRTQIRMGRRWWI